MRRHKACASPLLAVSCIFDRKILAVSENVRIFAAVKQYNLKTMETKSNMKEKLANARNLKANGVPVDVIAKSLGLAAEEVAEL